MRDNWWYYVIAHMIYSTEGAWLSYMMYGIYIFHGVCIEHESEYITLIIPLKQIHVFGD